MTGGALIGGQTKPGVVPGLELLQAHKRPLSATRRDFESNEEGRRRDSEGSKVDRVQRLSPDLRSHRIYTPYDTDDDNLTRTQRNMKNTGYAHRIARPIRRKDDSKHVYDLSKDLRLQIHFLPFGGNKDLVDALSRIYDLEPHAPSLQTVGYLEPEYT